MKERPILFTPDNVQLVREDKKTQTRRIVKTPKWAHQGDPEIEIDSRGLPICIEEVSGCFADIPCPYGMPGDRLWIKEGYLTRLNGDAIIYRNDYTRTYGVAEAAGFGAMYGGWKSPMFMPREYSRVILEITHVRAERLLEISEEDAQAEGIDDAWLVKNHIAPPYSQAYFFLWDSINGVHSHKEDPLVWAITFKKL